MQASGEVNAKNTVCCAAESLEMKTASVQSQMLIKYQKKYLFAVFTSSRGALLRELYHSIQDDPDQSLLTVEILQHFLGLVFSHHLECVYFEFEEFVCYLYAEARRQ